MFNYEKFENGLVQQMLLIFNTWTEQNHDLYIFSLDCADGMESIGAIANTTHYLEEQADAEPEDYWYYKYCEEEWDLFYTFEAISAQMYQYLSDNEDMSAGRTCPGEYPDAFDKHRDAVIKHCKNALFRFRKAINETHPDILLTFNIREYMDGDDRAEIFRTVNSETATKEYSEHIEEFA